MSEDIEKRKSFALFVALYETLEKQGCENISSMIDQLTKNDNSEISDYYKELRCLKQQLSEKAKEIKEEKLRYKALSVLFNIVNGKTKTECAIQQLERVREFCNNPLIQNEYGNIPEFRISNFIDQIIKELKGGE